VLTVDTLTHGNRTIRTYRLRHFGPNFLDPKCLNYFHFLYLGLKCPMDLKVRDTSRDFGPIFYTVSMKDSTHVEIAR